MALDAVGSSAEPGSITQNVHDCSVSGKDVVSLDPSPPAPNNEATTSAEQRFLGPITLTELQTAPEREPFSSCSLAPGWQSPLCQSSSPPSDRSFSMFDSTHAALADINPADSLRLAIEAAARKPSVKTFTPASSVSWEDSDDDECDLLASSLSSVTLGSTLGPVGSRGGSSCATSSSSSPRPVRSAAGVTLIGTEGNLKTRRSLSVDGAQECCLALVQPCLRLCWMLMTYASVLLQPWAMRFDHYLYWTVSGLCEHCSLHVHVTSCSSEPADARAEA